MRAEEGVPQTATASHALAQFGREWILHDTSALHQLRRSRSPMARLDGDGGLTSRHRCTSLAQSLNPFVWLPLGHP